MSQRDWNAHYAADELPWDTGEPEPALVQWLNQHTRARGRALEIGCGTGTNALWLAAHGYHVLGLDLAPLAIDKARAKHPGEAGQRCEFRVHDFLNGEPLSGSFALVFDRGCFHVFEEPSEQARFAQRVAAVLAPGGQWLSLIGSTEGAAREFGPPRRTAREIIDALEPSLELVSLSATTFPLAPNMPAAKAWVCLSRRRDEPAQPSTRWVGQG